MATFPYDHVITENLQTSAELVINTRPDSERAEWVAFLLNEMQALLPDDEKTGLAGAGSGAHRRPARNRQLVGSPRTPAFLLLLVLVLVLVRRSTSRSTSKSRRSEEILQQ